jgi:hypothetical protein
LTRILRYSGASNAALAQNHLHAHAASFALSFYARDAVYSFIPKNACSTMRYSLALANGAIEGPSQFTWIHANNNTFRASLRELARAEYTFVILRDPFLRLASCFLDKIVDQTHVAFKLRELTNYARQPYDFTFREFVNLLPTYLRADEHWRPQVDFLVYKTYDDAFAFEAFPAAVKTLKKRIGLVVHDARGLTKHGADQYKTIKGDAGVADLPAFDLLALKRAGKAPPLVNFYDRKLIDLVAALYADDIALYRQWTGRKPAF